MHNLIYAFPCLIDIIYAIVLNVALFRAAEYGFPSSYGAMLAISWAACYMLAARIAGRRVDTVNASRVIVVSVFIVGVLSVLGLFLREVDWQLVLVPVISAVMAFFFSAFQVFMKVVDQGRRCPVAESAGKYTFSWSMGFALGPLLCGWLWQVARQNSGWVERTTGLVIEGWEIAYLLNIFIAVGSLVAFLAIARRLADREGGDFRSSDIGGDIKPDKESVFYSGMPDFVWIGWICGGAGILAIILMRVMFPFSADSAHLNVAEKGLVLFTNCVVQGFVALAMGRGRFWMYRPSVLFAFGVVGVAGFCFFGMATTMTHFIVGSVLTGVFCGSLYPYFVFHSIVHPQKAARYACWNESIVGMVGICGPLAGIFVVPVFGLPAVYAAAAMILCCMILLQVVAHGRRRAELLELVRRSR